MKEKEATKIMYLIYKHTNKTNGKVYIGQTSKENLVERFGRGNKYTHSPMFYKAIKKYGWDGFTHEVIERNLTKAEANKRERYWIGHYHSFYRDKQCNGYNMTVGGGDLPCYQIDIETGNIIKEYPSLTAAANELKLTLGNLSKCCKGLRNKVGGYHWCLKEDYDNGRWQKPKTNK